MLIRNRWSLFALALLAACLLIASGCATFDHQKFQHKIQKMSDRELLDYYHGMQARIKDLAHGMREHEDLYVNDQRHKIHSTPFSNHGEGYVLVKKSEMVLSELRARNIKP